MLLTQRDSGDPAEIGRKRRWGRQFPDLRRSPNLHPRELSRRSRRPTTPRPPRLERRRPHTPNAESLSHRPGARLRRASTGTHRNEITALRRGSHLLSPNVSILAFQSGTIVVPSVPKVNRASRALASSTIPQKSALRGQDFRYGSRIGEKRPELCTQIQIPRAANAVSSVACDFMPLCTLVALARICVDAMDKRIWN